MRVTVETNINTKALRDRVMNDNGLWTYAATEWHRLYSPYVPYKEGLLDNGAVITPGQIEHAVPYARYQYYGEHLHHKYAGAQHPKASAKWDLAAEPTQKPKLIAAMQGYIDSGRLKLQ